MRRRRAEAAAGGRNGRHIAIDGKTVRGAVQPAAPARTCSPPTTSPPAPCSARTTSTENERDHLLVPLLNAILEGHDSAPADDSSDGDGDNDRHSDEKGGEEEGREGQELIIVTADVMIPRPGTWKRERRRNGRMLILKDNEPGLYAAADAHIWEDVPPARHQRSEPRPEISPHHLRH